MSVRIGFIGAGGIAQAHMKALSLLKNAKIVAVHDINGQLAAQSAEPFGAKVSETVHEVIHSSGIDALYLCTPPFARDDMDVLAAMKGIHLFVEKPLGLEISAVMQKEQAIRQSGIIHSSGYCLRYMDTVQTAKAYLQDKQVELISGYRLNGLHTPQWWRQLALSGGNFVDAATHQVDLIRYLAGEIDEVYARFERNTIHEVDPEATIYDKGTVSFKLKSGGIGTILDSCVTPTYPRSEVEFIGRDFHLLINGGALTIVDEFQNVTKHSEVDCMLEQARCFIRAVETKSQDLILCGYTEALKTLAVTLAANRSAVEKTAVKVDSIYTNTNSPELRNELEANS